MDISTSLNTSSLLTRAQVFTNTATNQTTRDKPSDKTVTSAEPNKTNSTPQAEQNNNAQKRVQELYDFFAVSPSLAASPSNDAAARELHSNSSTLNNSVNAANDQDDSYRTIRPSVASQQGVLASQTFLQIAELEDEFLIIDTYA